MTMGQTQIDPEPIPISDFVRYHEAGHAVAAEKTGLGLVDEPCAIVIVNDETAGANVNESGKGSSAFWSQLRADIKLAGPAADCIATNVEYSPAELRGNARYAEDFKQAGIELGLGPMAHCEDLAGLIETCYRAHATVRDNWKAICAIAEGLRTERCMKRARVIELIKGAEENAPSASGG